MRQLRITEPNNITLKRSSRRYNRWPVEEIHLNNIEDFTLTARAPGAKEAIPENAIKNILPETASENTFSQLNNIRCTNFWNTKDQNHREDASLVVQC